MITPQIAVLWLWIGWFVTWWIAALWAKRAIARPRLGLGVLHRVFASFGFWLMFLPLSGFRPPVLADPLWAELTGLRWGLVGLTGLGFAFCWWARLHLGALWSGLTTVKADHHVVDTGPYGLVRHPIYTGVIASALFTGLIQATLSGLLGAALIGFGFWLTARSEEAFLRQSLGTEAYDAYAARTPMLIPGLR